MILIDDFIVDAALREDHTINSQVTDHPVESGADISDHVRAEPIVITLDCIVSNTPIGPVVAARNLNTSLPSDEAYAKLIAIRNARQPVVVSTSLRRFENMVLQSLSIPRSSEDGDTLRFSVVFKQVELVQTQRTKIKVAAPRNQKRVNRGALPAKASEVGVNSTEPNISNPVEPKKEVDRRSLLGQGLGFLGAKEIGQN